MEDKHNQSMSIRRSAYPPLTRLSSEAKTSDRLNNRGNLRGGCRDPVAGVPRPTTRTESGQLPEGGPHSINSAVD